MSGRGKECPHTHRPVRSKLSVLEKKYSKRRDERVKDFVAVSTVVVRKTREAQVSTSS